MGRKAWLFCGSELAGQRAGIVKNLLQSAKLNGHDPHAYLRDVLERLPSHPTSRITSTGKDLGIRASSAGSRMRAKPTKMSRASSLLKAKRHSGSSTYFFTLEESRLSRSKPWGRRRAC
jgi:hypothetical protein